MPKFIETMGGAVKHFCMNVIEGGSTRVQLILATFFCWMFGIFYFATMVPLVREVSIIYYRQNSIAAKAVDLDSVYGSTILTMLGTAFMAVVAGYIVSKQYENKLNTVDVKDQDTERVDKIFSGQSISEQDQKAKVDKPD